jgi:uncharacterized surface protein with fasciclin (FAS1) repeats
MKTRNLMALVLVFGLFFGTAYANNKKDSTPKEKEQVVSENTTEPEVKEQVATIVGVAVANENFTTLVATVKAAGLVETLSGSGPFTVFAPLNSAFEKLPAGTVEGLLKPESKDALTSILTYHVVAGKFMAADVVKAIGDHNGSFSIPTVQGGTLTATIVDGSVILTDAKGNASKVVLTDVTASNGVIHAIDTVVMP